MDSKWGIAEKGALGQPDETQPGGALWEQNAASHSLHPSEVGSVLPAPASHEVRDGRRWVVLRTKARQEKVLARALDAARIHFTLLLYRSVKYYQHRKREAQVPLFPGYIFMWGSDEERVAALETGRVVQTIRVVDQVTLEHELGQIRRAIDDGATLDPFPYLKIGRRARVVAGPFRGMEGVIDERKKMDRLILLIQAVGRAVSLEIDASLLEPIDG